MCDTTTLRFGFLWSKCSPKLNVCLCLQIMKAFKVAPYDQHLMFNGVPLLDGLATLGHLGIVPGSTLLLKVGPVT